MAAMFKAFCFIFVGFVLLSSGYGRKHEGSQRSPQHHRHVHKYQHILKRHLNADEFRREERGSKRSEKVEESSHIWLQKGNKKNVPSKLELETNKGIPIKELPNKELPNKIPFPNSGKKPIGNGGKIVIPPGGKLVPTEVVTLPGGNKGPEYEIIDSSGKPVNPGKPINPQPGQGGNPQPGQGGNLQPGQGGNRQPGQGGNPQPGQGGNPQPGQGGNPQPGQGGNPQPGQGGNPQPGQGVSNSQPGATGDLPSFEEFQKGEITDGSSFKLNDACSVTAKKTESRYQLSSSPPDCVNLAILLEKVLPKGKANFESTTFMTLEKIIIRSISLDTSTKGVEIAASYTGTATLIKDILTVSNIRVGLSFVWTRSQKFTFDIGATFTVGDVPIDLRLIRNEEAYYFSADATANFNATTISRMFKQEDSFLPSTCLRSQLKQANLDKFTVINPRLRATFGDGYGFLFAGSVRILDWDAFDVNILINKPNDLPTTVTIAVYTHTFSISKMLKDLFEMDISAVPVLGTVEVRNLAFSLSTGDVETPLTVLDIGSEDIFDIPYRKGLKVSFEIPIAGIYVATSIFISPTLISFTVSQNGELNLGHVIHQFLPTSDLTETTGGQTRLKNWPSFIPDPLSIALVYFHLESSKPTGSWALTKMNMKLKMTHEISWFNEKIHINNLELDLNYEKGEESSSLHGIVKGRVALGAEDSRSPRVDVRIPFPFKNQEISFTFTDFSVESVVEALAGADVFPEDFPELFKHIQLDKIAISFDDAGAFDTISVDASIPGLWQIFGQFSIGNVKIHFEYGKASTTPPDTGTTGKSAKTCHRPPPTTGPGTGTESTPPTTEPGTGTESTPPTTEPGTGTGTGNEIGNEIGTGTGSTDQHTGPNSVGGDPENPPQPNRRSDQSADEEANTDTDGSDPNTHTSSGGTSQTTAQKTWRLVVKGQIVIATCIIEIEADFGSNLVSISAAGTRCSVSVGDILEKIHLNSQILPSMISGFTIFNPKLRVFWQRPQDVTEVGSKSIAFAATTNLFHESEVELALIRHGDTSAVVAAFAVEANAISEISFLSSLGLTDVAVVYVSKRLPIAPYKFLNPSFNCYIEQSPDPGSKGMPENKGITIYARFVPSPDNMLGHLLREGVKKDGDLRPRGDDPPTILVEISFPALVFELTVKLGEEGLQLGEIEGFRFTEMRLIISKQLIGLSLECVVQLERDGEPSRFTGSVSFTFTGTVTISLLWTGEWKNPFNLSPRLTIHRLGLALGINVADLVPSFGITGAITVNVPQRNNVPSPIDVELTLCIDPSSPGNTVFELHFTRLLLEDLVNLFANKVVRMPQKLAEVGFPDEVYIFFSADGNPDCFGKRYDPGVEVHGTLQIPFLSIRARIDLSIVFEPFKLDANLVLDPIVYLGGLIKVVDADSDTIGAHLKMHITENLSELMIDGSCRIEIFGAMISVQLQINKEKFFFEGRLNLWNLFQVHILVDISLTKASRKVHVIGEMQNDLFAKLKQKASQAIQNGAREINRQIEGAQQKILNAEHEVNKLQGYIDYHERKINEARAECRRAPWYKKIICIGTGAKILYHGAIIAGLEVARVTALGVLEAARYFLKGVEAVIKVGAEVLQKLVNAALSIIDIQYVRFEVEMDGVTKRFDFDARIVILGWTFTPHFSIDFSSSDSANAGINDAGQSLSDDTLEKVKK